MHTESKGILAEIIAAILLIAKGFKILERRYRTSCGEIDIIAKKRDIVVFVEVKSRKSLEKCYNAIVNAQLMRIQRASEIFLDKNKKLNTYSRRYDVILVSGWRIPTHIENISM